MNLIRCLPTHRSVQLLTFTAIAFTLLIAPNVCGAQTYRTGDPIVVVGNSRGTLRPNTFAPSQAFAREEDFEPGEVVAQRVGSVIIDLGEEEGLRVGSRIEFFRIDDIDLGAGQIVHQRRSLAVGDVIVVGPSRSEVRIGVDEIIPTGAIARQTFHRSSASRLARPRPTGMLEINANIRPFISLGPGGFGLLFDASVGYRFRRPMYLEAAVTQMGGVLNTVSSALGSATQIPSATITARALGMIDLDLVSFGLGFGAATYVHNQGETTPAIVVTQAARFGSVDGFHVYIENMVAIVDGLPQELSANGDVQIPIGERFWMIIRASGGASGYALGEAGIRVLLRGNGGSGSYFVTPTFGGAGVFNGSATFAGPHFGLGITVRP